jgi:hypothetical protein
MRLLTKYVPMLAVVQARTKLPNCHCAGRLHGLEKISLSVLKAVSTAQISGTATRIAHTARKPWVNTLSVRSPVDALWWASSWRRGRRCGRSGGVVAGADVPSVIAVLLSTRSAGGG